jgi:hypothetical protein
MRGQKMPGSEQALLSAAKGRQDDKAASPSQRSAPSRWQASHPHAAPLRHARRRRAHRHGGSVASISRDRRQRRTRRQSGKIRT